MTGLGASIMTYTSKMTGFRIVLNLTFSILQGGSFLKVNVSVCFDKPSVYLYFGRIKLNKAFVISLVLTHRLRFIRALA